MNLIGVAGWSGSGKTTLIERLLPALTALDWRVGVVKHAHHNFDADVPGKDTHRFRMAGACAVLATSPRRWAMIRELEKGGADGADGVGAGEVGNVLEQGRRLVREGGCDLVLAEGFKLAAIPKLEVWRRVLGRPLLSAADANFIGVISADVDGGDLRSGLSCFSPEDVSGIASFISARFRGKMEG